MSEKILELFDLLFTFILIGSLIREIPAVKKMLITAEDALELGSKVLPKKTDHELILWFSRAFGFISLFFFILFLISPYLASKFSLQINPNLQLSLILHLTRIQLSLLLIYCVTVSQILVLILVFALEF